MAGYGAFATCVRGQIGQDKKTRITNAKAVILILFFPI